MTYFVHYSRDARIIAASGSHRLARVGGVSEWDTLEGVDSEVGDFMREWESDDPVCEVLVGHRVVVVSLDDWKNANGRSIVQEYEPPRGSSGVFSPPRGGSVMSLPNQSEVFDTVKFLRDEIERLRLELRAEKEENRRLRAAEGQLREAVGESLGILRAVMALSVNQEYLDAKGIESAMSSVIACIEEADDLTIPVAQET